MASNPPGVTVRVADARDVAVVAQLRGGEDARDDPEFERRIGAWLADEGDRRTLWLAEHGGAAVGFASVFEYRRMPRPGHAGGRWGYVGNMFVREDARNRGIGSALLAAIIAAAEERGYVRLVLSPTVRSVPFYRRAGFIVPDEDAGGDRLLVRPR